MSELRLFEEQDPTFVADLKHSQIAVERIAQWTRERYGCEATVLPLRIRRFAGEMGDYSDGGDFDAHIEGLDYRVDPKRCDTEKNDFTCPADFPFQRIFVCQCHQWDKPEPKAHTFIYTNIAMTFAGITRGASRWSWIEHPYNYRGRPRRGYLCPLDHVEWVEIRLKGDDW